ncbi:hypothetical protein ES705_31576 [subsurface metagenome]
MINVSSGSPGSSSGWGKRSIVPKGSSSTLNVKSFSMISISSSTISILIAFGFFISVFFSIRMISISNSSIILSSARTIKSPWFVSSGDHSNAASAIARAIVNPISKNNSLFFSRFALFDFFETITFKFWFNIRCSIKGCIKNNNSIKNCELFICSCLTKILKGLARLLRP